MSDTVKQCIQCKTSIKIFKFCKKGEDDKFLDFWDGFINYKSLNTFCKNESYNNDFKNNICPFCKNELIDTMLTRDDFKAISKASNYNRDLLLAMIELRKKDVIEFEAKMQPFRQKQDEHEKEMKRITEERVAERDKVHCPKCGCTDIQVVPRKWSLLTGFMTNKTDRVCVKCKYKF